MSEQVVYRFYVLKYVLAILSDDEDFPKAITLKDMKKEIPGLDGDVLIGFMQEIVRCATGWGCTQLDPIEFNPRWVFRKPSLKQLAVTVWALSSGDDCKHVTIP